MDKADIPMPGCVIWIVNLADIELAYGRSAAHIVVRAVFRRLADLGVAHESVRQEGDAFLLAPVPFVPERSPGGNARDEWAFRVRWALGVPVAVGGRRRVCPAIEVAFANTGEGTGIRSKGSIFAGVSAVRRPPAEPGASWRRAFRRDMATASGLADDLRAGRLGIAFQPVVLIHARSSVLYDELLLRPPGGNAASGTGALEKQGLVWQLDCCMVWTSIDMLGRHPQRSLGCNVSAVSFYPEAWWFDIIAYLRACPSIARRLVLEITETGSLRDVDKALNLLMRLQELGVRIALDDVGVGTCALAFLIDASPDIVKIDRSLLRRAARSRAGKRQLSGLINLCCACSPCVIMEGVENDGDLLLVEGTGVAAVQGYAIGRPTVTPEWVNGVPKYVLPAMAFLQFRSLPPAENAA